MKKVKIISAIVAIVLFLGLFVFVWVNLPNQSLGNSLWFDSPCQTATATSTLSSVVAGTATTTLSCDLGMNSNRAATNLTLNMWVTASSTETSSIMVRPMWSRDTNDYYSDYTVLSDNATSTILVGPQEYQYHPATSTDLITGKAIGTASYGAPSRISMEIRNPTKARYIKVYFYAPVGTKNSLIWAELIPKREQQ